MATITYTVTVATGTNQYGTGNKFYLNGTVSPDINLIEGNTYIFDQSVILQMEVVHILRFSTTPIIHDPAGTLYNRCNYNRNTRTMVANNNS